MLALLLAQAGQQTRAMGQFQPRAEEYYFPYWCVGLLVAYLVSFVLVKTKKLSLVTQRKFWNACLGLFFFSVALTGIYLVIRSQYHIQISLPFDIKFLHVETGIAFSVIALFHILWHLTYFKTYLKK